MRFLQVNPPIPTEVAGWFKPSIGFSESRVSSDCPGSRLEAEIGDDDDDRLRHLHKSGFPTNGKTPSTLRLTATRQKTGERGDAGRREAPENKLLIVLSRLP